MSIEVRPQSAKAPAPMVVITALSSNFAVFIAVHPLNALFSIVVTPFGKLNSCNWARLWKAPALIVVRSQSPRKLKCLSFVLLWSALSRIFVSLEPLGTLTVSRLLDNEKIAANSVKEEGNVTFFRLSHWPKAPFSIVFTFEGSSKVTFSKPYILLNALSLIVSTLVGIVKSLIVLEPKNAFFSMVLTQFPTMYFPSVTGFAGGKK